MSDSSHEIIYREGRLKKREMHFCIKDEIRMDGN